MPVQGEGDFSTARDLARYNIRVIERLQGIEAIITDCATCGSTLKGYSQLLSENPEFKNRATSFSRRVYDISEFLAQIGLKEPCRKIDFRVTYHDPCHLARAQGVRAQPRDLIEVTGAQLVEMRESDWCCGSAGIHLFTHHETSTKLLERKMINVMDTGAEVVATGCPGCQLQLILGSKRSDTPIQILHPVQLLDTVYGEKSADEPLD
jgi:glycolate oxidase iron-sulfur subunit